MSFVIVDPRQQTPYLIFREEIKLQNMTSAEHTIVPRDFVWWALFLYLIVSH